MSSNIRVDEHLNQDCWCLHRPQDHRWDAARDYRELECLRCQGLQGSYRVEFMAE